MSIEINETTPFGVDVMVRRNDQAWQLGKFIAYNKDNTVLPYYVWVGYEDVIEVEWFSECKLAENKIDETTQFGVDVLVKYDDELNWELGKFIAYNKDNTVLPYYVWVEDKNGIGVEASWFNQCKLIEQKETL